MKRNTIYVETEIQASLDEVWRYTQTPHLHEQWDLRFTSITYQPKTSPIADQHFTYCTRVMPGIKVSGWGVSKGTHEKNGIKTSSLHFGTSQKISPIREGKGYWQYRPEKETVIFLTQYDYTPRFGRIIDRLFRPLIAYGTALSFDVLKRWLEQGESPKTQYRRFFACILIYAVMAFIWAYQGIVPKLLIMHPEEVAMVQYLTLGKSEITLWVVRAVGVLEVLFAMVWLLPFHKKRLLQLQVIGFPILTIIAYTVGATITAPFNMFTFNAALFILSIIGVLLVYEVPSTKSCKRKKSE
ncbi:membrane protein [Lysinibacillus alkalisoli]|uniref:Membrane protein n=1 Tax=Lysinibacillus alkalisoli TaxID=1911548 RepID=A0A917LD41_9BACI|nr:DoxX-like family protein [Lysinibacillus alkalisoli]GGG14355.1 membrane protein [Lysinibacillus alkalisoli]